MKPELQRRIQRYGWDHAAPHYESGWQKQLQKAQNRLLKTTGLQPGERVLDVSCGTGLVTVPMAKTVTTDGSVTAIDLSSGMIDAARQRFRDCGLDNASFRRMDAEEMELNDNTFDVVLCSLGLMYFPNPDRAMKEIYRVLKPGGRATALVWGRRDRCGWADIFPIVDRRVESDVCPLFFQLGTGEALANTFEQAGFEDVQSDRFSDTLHFEDDEQACIAAFLGGAVALAYRKFDEKTKEEVHKEYLESIRHFQNGEGYDVPGEFVIAKGRK